MACQIFNLINSGENACYAVKQGITYDILTFYYKDLDLTSYTPSGEIRDNYIDQSGVILATFSFQPLIFGSVTIGSETFNATTIQPFLNASDTALISRPPLPLGEGQNPVLGLTAWTYDIKLTSIVGDVKELGRGLVQVLPDTTTR